MTGRQDSSTRLETRVDTGRALIQNSIRERSHDVLLVLSDRIEQWTLQDNYDKVKAVLEMYTYTKYTRRVAIKRKGKSPYTILAKDHQPTTSEREGHNWTLPTTHSYQRRTSNIQTGSYIMTALHEAQLSGPHSNSNRRAHTISRLLPPNTVPGTATH